MTTVTIAYIFLSLGFCLGFVACGLVRMNEDEPAPMTPEEEARQTLDRG